MSTVCWGSWRPRKREGKPPVADGRLFRASQNDEDPLRVRRVSKAFLARQAAEIAAIQVSEDSGAVIHGIPAREFWPHLKSGAERTCSYYDEMTREERDQYKYEEYD